MLGCAETVALEWNGTMKILRIVDLSGYCKLLACNENMTSSF